MSEPKLRLDGVYIQLGNNHWITQNYKSNICWYNLLINIDNYHVVLLGSNTLPFWDKDEDHIYMNRSLYNFLGVSNPSDPVLTAKEISNLPSAKLLELYDCIMTISSPPKKINNSESINKDVAVLESNSERFTLYYKDNPLMLYDKGSKFRLQNINGVMQDHNFPFIFVTDNNSNGWAWRNAFENWVDHRNNDIYLYCEICRLHHKKFYSNDDLEKDVCLDCAKTLQGKNMIRMYDLQLD
jgi:hypothetical protein